MGYNVHITRQHHWVDKSSAQNIPKEEWLAYIKNDPELKLEQSQHDDTLAYWENYSQHGKDGDKAWMYWDDGEITLKNPDQEILKKMYKVAINLNAKLQGDDGELYDESGHEIPQTT